MSGAGTPEPTAQAPSGNGQDSSGYGAYVPGRSGRPEGTPGPATPYGPAGHTLPGAAPRYAAQQHPYGYAGQQFPGAGPFAGAGRGQQVTQLRRGPDGTAVLRPSRSQLWRSAGAISPVFLVAAAFSVLRRGLPGLAIAGVVLAVCVVLLALHLRRSRIVVTPLRVERTRLLGTTSFALADVGQVLLFPFRPPGGADRGTYLTTLVRDRAGRRLLMIRSDMWDPQDVVALAGSLGVTPARTERALSPREVEAAFPGTIPFAQRHPVPAAFLLTVAIVIVAGAAVVLMNL
ncbi:hypothetical protein KZX45_03650 [Georgenia sp. EYE_87]|uniref:hypothetical protein n=1 Tax=Georgenia sp. EYE_87 TaxID=2853448 RepID=UPI002002C57A|nr:hypothetical protein [Georgenia sp. EYE_87]MCK6209638.1 hypothetical protein [Georgenia sp. EYE_87]